MPNYIEERGIHNDFSTSYDGRVKLRLAHGQGYSLLTVDLVVLMERDVSWFQPYSFTASMILKMDDGIRANLHIDIKNGHSLRIEISEVNWVRQFRDGSELYNCRIKGPPLLRTFADGTASINAADEIHLDLFHHTNDASKKLICSGGTLWGSAWNLQGTRKLKNVSYCYLTSLPSVRTRDDLQRIAMASDGYIYMLRDGFDPPPLPPRALRQLYKEDILRLNVYRESTLNRTATIALKVDATALAPQHLLRHHPTMGAVYYEISNPRIQRIGICPGSQLSIDSGTLLTVESALCRFGYVVVGDARTLAGLAAPFNEEDTTFIMKYQIIPSHSNVLKFWIENANSDLYSGHSIAYQEFA